MSFKLNEESGSDEETVKQKVEFAILENFEELHVQDEVKHKKKKVRIQIDDSVDE